ncbi:unnamed protein product [Agarophyton chilense]
MSDPRTESQSLRQRAQAESERDALRHTAKSIAQSLVSIISFGRDDTRRLQFFHSVGVQDNSELLEVLEEKILSLLAEPSRRETGCDGADTDNRPGEDQPS